MEFHDCIGKASKKFTPKEDAVIQWHTQAGSITNNLKVNIDFTLPELSATEIVTWNCHVDDLAKGRYDIILGRDILTTLGLNLKLLDHVIEADSGTFKGSTSPMVDMGTYEFKDLNTEKITLKEYFTNSYAEEIYESDQFRTSNKRLNVILDAKYEMAYINKVMKTQCQHPK